MNQMTDPTEAIRKALEAGPTDVAWQNQEMPTGTESIHGSRVVSFITSGTENIADVCDSRGLSEQEARANAALIAACNPAAIRSLLDRLDSAERDARRYRWLREQDDDDFCFSVVKNPHFDVYQSPEELDAAIDAALRAGEQKEPK